MLTTQLINRRKLIPDPFIVSLQPIAGQIDAHAVQPNEPIELRSVRVEEFLHARSLAPKSQKAYRQDLRCFLNW